MKPWVLSPVSHKNLGWGLAVVMNAFNPSTQDGERQMDLYREKFQDCQSYTEMSQIKAKSKHRLAIKRVYWSCKGSQISSQQSCELSHNKLTVTPSPGAQYPLLASTGTVVICTNLYSNTHIYI